MMSEPKPKREILIVDADKWRMFGQNLTGLGLLFGKLKESLPPDSAEFKLAHEGESFAAHALVNAYALGRISPILDVASDQVHIIIGGTRIEPMDPDNPKWSDEGPSDDEGGG